jgi:hypothetical protein
METSERSCNFRQIKQRFILNRSLFSCKLRLWSFPNLGGDSGRAAVLMEAIWSSIAIPAQGRPALPSRAVTKFEIWRCELAIAIDNKRFVKTDVEKWYNQTKHQQGMPTSRPRLFDRFNETLCSANIGIGIILFKFGFEYKCLGTESTEVQCWFSMQIVNHCFSNTVRWKLPVFREKHEYEFLGRSEVMTKITTKLQIWFQSEFLWNDLIGRCPAIRLWK